MTTEWSRVNTYISQCERHRRSPILSTRCSGLVERRNSSLTIIRKYRKGLRSGVSRLKRTMLRKIGKKKRIISWSERITAPLGHRPRAQRARVETYVRQRIPRSLVQGGVRAHARVHLCVYMLYTGSPVFV